MTYATQQRFVELGSRLGINEADARSIHGDLVARYGEPHRQYHTLAHINRMLRLFNESGQGSDRLELAIWFHDCVYDPMAKDNEAASAEHFRLCMGDRLSPGMVEDVSRLILATDPSRARSGDPEEDLLMDIDLSILAAPDEEYGAYCAAVRQEYAMVPEPDFHQGRAKILRLFLSAPIFSTPTFRCLEDTARKNIGDELAVLEME